MYIFLSHSHRDRAIAEALDVLLESLFDGRVQVEFSSDQTASGGIPPGEQWLPWIKARIAAADKTFVLLTPSSLRRPWVLWESGAAAGIAMASERTAPVVPITFGIDDADIPSPFLGTQCIKGDERGAGGIRRLLQRLNDELDTPLTPIVFTSVTGALLDDFFATVELALERTTPTKPPLECIEPDFSTKLLEGIWATCYEFESHGTTRCHADLTMITAESDRRVTADNGAFNPRTEGRLRPFRNDISARLAGRHLLGEWKNASDQRFFGMIHLAVLSGENVMEGHYTALANDVTVTTGYWRWVRIDPSSMHDADFGSIVLLDPVALKDRIFGQDKYRALLTLGDISEGS